MSKQCISCINKYNSDRELGLIQSGNLGSFYKYVNSKTSYKSGVAPLMDNSGNLLGNDSDKTRLLNNYFASVFVKDNGLMPKFEPLVDDSSNKINAVYFSPDKVIKAIKKLRTSDCGGDDKLTNIYFLNVAPEIAFPLSCIFYLSMTALCVPST